MKKKLIPDDVKEKALCAIDRFNKTRLRGTEYAFVARFQGKFLYLEREEYGRVGPICRLEYRGGKKGWGFAIYKYSTERYDPQEWMFPGSELVDGTIEGAMKAGMRAYQ
jgi:hypothetical protein